MFLARLFQLLIAPRSPLVQGIPNVKELQEMGMSPACIHKAGFDGSPIQLVRQGAVDALPLIDLWTDEEILRFNNLQKEEAWLIVDEVTRRTRRLVKLILINDFRGMSMSKVKKENLSPFSSLILHLLSAS